MNGSPLKYYDAYGLLSMEPLWRGIYNVTNGWSPSQSTVNAVAGIGNGMSFGIAGALNRALGQSVDFCSSAYTYGNLAGMAVGGAGAVGKAAASGLFRHNSLGMPWGSQSSVWNNVSRRVHRAQQVPRGHQLHHYGIEQRSSIGRHISNLIKNHPANLHAIPRNVHTRIHGRNLQTGQPQYGVAQAWWLGTPGWAKAVQGLVMGGLGSQVANAAGGGCGCNP